VLQPITTFTLVDNERTFPNVQIYIFGVFICDTVSLRRSQFCAFIYFRNETATGPYPFSDPFTLSPLSILYLESSGHRIFSLMFDAEITVIEEPIRICFHDPTQELVISLSFAI
jgi:hypothetical protein